MRIFLTIAGVFLLLIQNAGAAGLGGLKDVPFDDLSHKSISRYGQQALQMRKDEWKHAETKNFVYHYFQSHIATAVSVEAEFYYKGISSELEKDTEQWERKCHIYIFEKEEDWSQFKVAGKMEPWTGGLHMNGELFIVRRPEMKFKGSTLAHEVTHLVLDRFYGSGIPLWINEGFAEYAGERFYNTYYRARGYVARPTAPVVQESGYIPLEKLVNAAAYPFDATEVDSFYNESHRLVRFLCKKDKKQFLELLGQLSKGGRFETSFSRTFGSYFSTISALEMEFKPYAISKSEEQ